MSHSKLIKPSSSALVACSSCTSYLSMPRIRTGWSDLTVTCTHVHTHEREHVYYIGISRSFNPTAELAVFAPDLRPHWNFLSNQYVRIDTRSEQHITILYSILPFSSFVGTYFRRIHDFFLMCYIINVFI